MTIVYVVLTILFVFGLALRLVRVSTTPPHLVIQRRSKRAPLMTTDEVQRLEHQALDRRSVELWNHTGCDSCYDQRNAEIRIRLAERENEYYRMLAKAKRERAKWEADR